MLRHYAVVKVIYSGTIYANALLWKRLYLDIFMGTVRLTAYRTLLVYFYVLRLGYSSIGKESTRD